MKRYPVYRAENAAKGLLAGAIGVALAVLAILGHRLSYVDVPQMLIALLVAALFGVGGILLCFSAFIGLWKWGGLGLGKALTGFFVSLVALVPAAALVFERVEGNEAFDLSTNPVDAPRLGHTKSVHAGNFLAAPGPLNLQEQSSLFPDIVPRRYRLPLPELHAVVLEVVKRSEWQVINQVPPDFPDAPTLLQAEVTSPILGLVEDVAIRLRPDRVGTLLDVRSASRYEARDVISNARRIRVFFEQVDELLLERFGNIAGEIVQDEGEEVLPPDQEANSAGQENKSAPLPPYKPYTGEPKSEEETPAGEQSGSLAGQN